MVVDRARFPSDTLSTHLIQVSGVRLMQELGLLDRLAGTAAPFLSGASVLYDGIDLSAPVLVDGDWPPGGISVGRNLLDGFMVEAAEKAGARVLTRTSLTGVRRDGTGRVSGALLRTGGEIHMIEADLVIGADGRNSRLSELVGARTYNTTSNQRFVYWADFEGVTEPGPSNVHHYRNGTDLTIAFNSDGGRFTIMVCPGLSGFGAFKRGLPDSYDDAVARCEPLRPLLAGARRCSRPIGTAYAPGYFRESAGRGWGLVGDAGHFKDPTLGQGISDALRQSKALAERLAGVDFADHRSLDGAVGRWARWRDRDAAPMYWLAWEFAREGRLPDLERAFMRLIARDPAVRQRFVDGVLSHRASPYDVLGPRLLLRAAWDMRRQGASGQDVAREVGARLASELRRQWLLAGGRDTSRCPGPRAGSTRRRSDPATPGRATWPATTR